MGEDQLILTREAGEGDPEGLEGAPEQRHAATEASRDSMPRQPISSAQFMPPGDFLLPPITEVQEAAL